MTNLASQEELQSQQADKNFASCDWKKYVAFSLSKQQHSLRKAARQLIAGGCAGMYT